METFPSPTHYYDDGDAWSGRPSRRINVLSEGDVKAASSVRISRPIRRRIGETGGFATGRMKYIVIKLRRDIGQGEFVLLVTYKVLDIGLFISSNHFFLPTLQSINIRSKPSQK
jgi:hypothetical protein